MQNIFGPSSAASIPPVPGHTQPAQPTSSRGVTLDRAIVLSHMRRPRPPKAPPRHPLHQQIRVIITRHHGRPLRHPDLHGL
eukprot:c27682_g2_i2 orf=57-299(+)